MTRPRAKTYGRLLGDAADTQLRDLVRVVVPMLLTREGRELLSQARLVLRIPQKPPPQLPAVTDSDQT